MALSPQENSHRIGNLDLIRSLQHSERDIFYSTIWEDHCLPAMHPAFRVLFGEFLDHSILTDATLALSSCSFSRLHPEEKASVSSSTGSFSPDLTHQSRSQIYYSSAIKRFSGLSESECRHNTTMLLMVLIVFAHIECSMGNFQGFYCHEKGIMSLLSHLPISLTTHLESLIASWMQVRIVIWWARAYFCSLEVQRQLLPVLPPGITVDGFSELQGRRVTVLSIMCESHRVNFGTLLRHWDTGDINLQERHPLQTSEGFQHVLEFLFEQKGRLDRWLESLPSSELPIEVPNGSKDICSSDEQTPIFFRSHEAALNFAYYTVARILQCSRLLEHLQNINSSYVPTLCHEEESWARVLLRIARGTKMETSLRMNRFTIGFSGLLLSALLRCQSQSLSHDIQAWLQDLEVLRPTEEGAFPLYQTLRVVNTINRQKMAARDVFAVTLSVDDEGGTPKINSYNSQSISGLLFHGISRTSGELFTDYLLVE